MNVTVFLNFFDHPWGLDDDFSPMQSGSVSLPIPRRVKKIGKKRDIICEHSLLSGVKSHGVKADQVITSTRSCEDKN